MNSVLQLLWALPELHQRYVDKAAHIFKTAPQDPAVDFATQFAKVSVAERLGRGSWRMPALCHKSNTWQPTCNSLHPPCSSQVGTALLTGKTDTLAAANAPQPMNYEAETMIMEGSLEAVVQV